MHSRVAISVVWVACRTCPEPKNWDTSEEVWEQGFWKEFHASQTVFSYDQILDYSGLMFPFEVRPSLSPSWTHLVLGLADHWTTRLNQTPILYPNVQRVKNVSEMTHHNYNLMRQREYVTTKDLEVLYGDSGYRAEGPCEMRASWKYADLKPRIYYCQGGTDYFRTRYHKGLAKSLLDAFPITRMDRRTSPFQYLRMDPEDHMITWDLTSFTTNLSELKYFIWYLARAMEDRQGYPLRLFDYHDGIVERNTWDLLDEYNESNMGSAFSIMRIADRFLLNVDTVDWVQENSGMLGVCGNIGYSMALHGFAIGHVVEHVDKAVCVGDDAFAFTRANPEDFIMPQISSLGDIQYQKFDIRGPFEDDVQVMRFLKRRVERSHAGIYQDFLHSLPLFPYIDGVIGRRTAPPDFNEHLAREKKVVTSVGSLLWNLAAHPLEVSDIEIQELRDLLSRIYFEMGFPQKGCLPGYRLRRDKNIEFPMAIPSLAFDHYDPRFADWVDWLLDNVDQDRYQIPVFGEPFERTLPIKGEYFQAVQSKFYAALEDMEIVRTEPCYEVVFDLSIESRRALSKALKKTSKSRMIWVSVLKDIPEKFQFFYRPEVLDDVDMYVLASEI
jgi:hypothetical protein